MDNYLIKKIFFSIKKEKCDYAGYIIVYGWLIKSLLDERLIHLLSIIEKKKYSKIVLTDSIGVNGDSYESEYMCDYLIKNGISGEKL